MNEPTIAEQLLAVGELMDQLQADANLRLEALVARQQRTTAALTQANQTLDIEAGGRLFSESNQIFAQELAVFVEQGKLSITRAYRTLITLELPERGSPAGFVVNDAIAALEMAITRAGEAQSKLERIAKQTPCLVRLA